MALDERLQKCPRVETDDLPGGEMLDPSAAHGRIAAELEEGNARSEGNGTSVRPLAARGRLALMAAGL